MAQGIENFNSPNPEIQDIEFQDLTMALDPLLKVTDVFRDQNDQNGINSETFESFLETYLEVNKRKELDLKGVSASNGKGILHFKDSSEIEFGYDDIQTIEIDTVLEGRSLQEIEKRVDGLNNAIESIFADNDKLWGFEINGKDLVKDGQYKGKTLAELRALLEVENSLLAQAYDISGEAKKKEALLKQEITFFAGVGDKYEGGARYFALSSEEIGKKVERLISRMSLQEIYDYITDLHKNIDDNYKKSDMVKQVNLKLMNSLYNQTFERIKKEQASTRDIIDFVKVLTGRGHGEENKDGSFDYEDLDFDEEYRDLTVANNAMLYIMTREGGMIDEIVDNENGVESVGVIDEALQGRSPSDILGQARDMFGNPTDQTGEKWNGLLKQMGMGLLVGKENTKYADLSIQEKVQLGGLARLLEVLSEVSLETIDGDPEKLIQFIKQQIPKLIGESFEEVNESFGENFDSLFGISGKGAKYMGLTGDRAELFELYQEINGNQFWDLSDANWWNIDNFTLGGVTTVGVSIAAAGVAIALLPATASIGLVAVAGATAGGITGLTSSLAGRQGFDSTSEAVWDTTSVVAADAALGALFLASSVKVFGKYGINILEAKFKSRYTLYDAVGFGGSEALFNGVFLTPLVTSHVKQAHSENHFDTDDKN